MHQLRTATLLSACLLASTLAQAVEPVSSTLSVSRVVPTVNGQEHLDRAVSARPGEMLEYAVDLHNAGSTAVHGLSATLPLPSGTELVAGSTRPAASMASVDGKQFQQIPLRRTVALADGTQREELVPLSEYRYLRWAPSDLGANADLKVSARVRVSAIGGAAGVVK